MPIIVFGIALLVANPAYAQFNYTMGLTTGFCNPTSVGCMVGKMQREIDRDYEDSKRRQRIDELNDKKAKQNAN